MPTCPRCEQAYDGFPALSRRDNQTAICSQCGTEEALIDFILKKGVPSAEEEAGPYLREIRFVRQLAREGK